MTGGTGSEGSILDSYADMVVAGQVKPDAAQKRAVEKLQDVSDGLAALEGRSGSVIASLFRRKREVPKGLYIWGDVGRGKTMLMDLFYRSVPLQAKRRVHFHEFMNEVHEAIAKFRADNPGTKGRTRSDSRLSRVPITRSVRLLCFDEFFVSDITDAMLLKRLFEILFADGVVVVATSNIPPDKLYWNGLNRQLFTALYRPAQRACRDSQSRCRTDYRREQLDAPGSLSLRHERRGRPRMDRCSPILSVAQNQARRGLKSWAGDHGTCSRRWALPVSALQICVKVPSARATISSSQMLSYRDDRPCSGVFKAQSDAAKRFILAIDTLL